MAAAKKTIAAKGKARVLEPETRLSLSARDFSTFIEAMDSAFAPDIALQEALVDAGQRVRSDVPTDEARGSQNISKS